MFKNFFEPGNEPSQSIQILNASHLDKNLQWQFDPNIDTQEVFQKLQVIGKGGFGTVCKVLHIPSNTILAGKLINPKLVNDPSTRKEIDHEISLMHEVNSDYTVHYYGSVQYKGSMMILMEYCDCGSLRDILDAREQVLSEDQISIVMHDLLKGLQLIRFQYRIVHRDIKAANILFTSTGEIKLADFGVSRRFEQQGTVHTRTIVGTPYWMAPEVINGKPYSYSADIWSVGITAVELAEGAPPYVEYAPTKAMIKISLKGFPGYRFKNMHSPEFLDFVSHCVQMDVDKRWDIQSLLDHPFIKRAERMSRLEVLDDLIRFSTNATAIAAQSTSHNGQMESSQFFDSNPFESDAFNSQKDQLGNSANLNTAHNFDGLDSFSNSRNGAMLNSATNFDSFQNGNLRFDSSMLNSRNDFDSFSARQSENGNMYMLNDKNCKGFDSFAGSQNYPSFKGFDSFAANGQNFSGFDSSLNSQKDFDSFAPQSPYQPNGFDSFASNPHGTNLQSAKGFDSFANSPYSPNEPSGFDSFASNRTPQYGFDSFAMNPNHNTGFDSFATPQNNFDQFNSNNLNHQFDSSYLNSSKGFDSFASNRQQENMFLNAKSPGFDSFQAGNGFDSFQSRNQVNIPSATNFDSFVGMRNNGLGSVNLNSQSGFDSFNLPGQQVKQNDQEFPSFTSFVVQQEQMKQSVNLKPGLPPLPPRPNKDPRVSFSQIPDDLFRQISRTNSLRTPFVSFKPDQLGKPQGENGQPVKVFYQTDDLIHKQQVSNENNDDDIEKPATWSPSPLFILFFFLLAVEFGPEGFVVAAILCSVLSFIFYYGKNKVKNHTGLIANEFQDQ